MAQQVIWNGTQQESVELLAAVQRNCLCEHAADGTRIKVCPPHESLVRDQRFLDGLGFGRRIADRLRAEEWRPVPPRLLVGPTHKDSAPLGTKSAIRPMDVSAL